LATRTTSPLKLFLEIWGAVGGIIALMIAAGQSPPLLDSMRYYPILRQFPDNQLLCMILAVLLGAATYFILLIHQTELDQRRRKRGLYSLFLMLLVPAGLWSCQLWMQPGSEALMKQLLAHCWVGYNPLDYDPTFRPDPSIESIRRDLNWIHSAGFTGIVTFGSKGSLSGIPSKAHDEGLAVIMGVWNPNDKAELGAAAANKEWVLGYSVGHDKLDDYDSPGGYSLSELKAAVQFLRENTSRPVTTTERAKNYDEPGEDRLAQVSDWLFPDVHLSLDPESPDEPKCTLSEEGVPECVNQLIASALKVEVLARRLHRPLMLKMVTFPHDGPAGASPELQRAFFQRLTEQLGHNDSPLRKKPALMVNSAFDAPWKTGVQYRPWDPYTGLISGDSAVSPAAAEVVRRCPGIAPVEPVR